MWKKAVDLTVKIYSRTKAFPAEEKFGLTSQIRRSATSIAANIAEGAGRGTDRDFANFLSIAAGSTFELETHLIIANKIELLSADSHYELICELDQIKKMLFSLRQKLLH